MVNPHCRNKMTDLQSFAVPLELSSFKGKLVHASRIQEECILIFVDNTGAMIWRRLHSTQQWWLWYQGATLWATFFTFQYSNSLGVFFNDFVQLQLEQCVLSTGLLVSSAVMLLGCAWATEMKLPSWGSEDTVVFWNSLQIVIPL
jgi:hypothetical protein